MGTGYWILEYGKVFLAYLFLMFVYPSILFHSYLKGKSRTFWFGFCTCGQVMLVSTVILLLGLCHILNAWVLRGIFYGSLLWLLIRKVRLRMTPEYFVYKYGKRTYGKKLLFLRVRLMVKDSISRGLQGIRAWMKKDTLELIALALLVGYGVLYFSYSPLQDRFYGFSDIPVHHAWMYGLAEGKAFSAGIYPEAMHCVGYAISALFGIRLYSVVIFLQCIHMGSFLVAVYLLARELFAWKYTALLALTLFLTLRHESVTLVYLLSRMQTALPQEFGLYAVLLITTFLVRYLKSSGPRKGRKTKFYWDENLIIFCLAIASTLACHFYATIMAIFTCIGVALVWWIRLFNWRRLVPLVCSALLALVLAAAPMALAFAEGIPLQGSLYWALGVMSVKGPDQQDIEPSAAADTLPVQQEPAQQVTVQQEPVRQEQKKAGMWDLVKRNYNGFYNGGYRNLYSQEWSDVLIRLSVAALALPVAYRLVILILKWAFRKKKLRVRADLLDGYAILAQVATVLMLALSAGSTSFPVFIATDRVYSLTHAAVLLMAAFPLDLIGLALSAFLGGWAIQMVGILGAAAVFATVVLSGNYHSFLYLRTTRFSAAVDVTNAIIDTIPRMEYTIISPTDELYQVRDYGFHEELLTYMQQCEKDVYRLPTRYLFYYLEKKPVRYDINHYADGPAWLARQEYYERMDNVGRGRDYVTGSISEEKLEQSVVLGSKPSNAYTSLYNREILESKMWKYLDILKERYPNAISVFYEDEYFVCYCLEQNPLQLVNLSEKDR